MSVEPDNRSASRSLRFVYFPLRRLLCDRTESGSRKAEVVELEKRIGQPNCLLYYTYL